MVVVLKSILGISISMSRSVSSSISLQVNNSFNGCLVSTVGLTFGIDTMVEIEGLAVKDEMGIKD